MTMMSHQQQVSKPAECLSTEQNRWRLAQPAASTLTVQTSVGVGEKLPLGCRGHSCRSRGEPLPCSTRLPKEDAASQSSLFLLSC